MSREYHPPRWLPGRHLQTIVPAAWLGLAQIKSTTKSRIKYRREEWTTPDGDFIELDWLLQTTGLEQAASQDGASSKDSTSPELATPPLAVLFHGLEGNAQSHYALRLMAGIRQQGWHGVVVHFRGCGGKPNLKPRGYHCGDSAEIDWILRRLRQQHAGKLYALGVSLGGNALLKWLGEQQAEAASIIDKAIAISAPLALPTTGHVLGSGFNRFYAWLFLKTLRPKALAMIDQHQLAFDSAAIKQVTNLWHYDDLFTAPLHGFKNADDYWEQSNSRPYLKTIQVPTLLINAQNDPFLPAKDLPAADEVSTSVVREFPRQGGHAGFMNAGMAEGNDWLAQRVLSFLQSGH